MKGFSGRKQRIALFAYRVPISFFNHSFFPFLALTIAIFLSGLGKQKELWDVVRNF